MLMNIVAHWSQRISSFLHQIDALRWTPHMDECLCILDEGPEGPNDEILVQQVRLQLIVEKVNCLENWQGGLKGRAYRARAPPSFYLQALQSQVEEVRSNRSFRSDNRGKLPVIS
jgi:hypothetical protein